MKFILAILLSWAAVAQLAVYPSGTVDPTLMAAQIPPGPCAMDADLVDWVTPYGLGDDGVVLRWGHWGVSDPLIGRTWVLAFFGASQAGPWDAAVLWAIDPQYLLQSVPVDSWWPTTSLPRATRADVKSGTTSVWVPGLTFWMTGIWFVPDVSGLFHVHVAVPTLIQT